MYEDLFNKLYSRNSLEENLRTVCEGKTWEQISLLLYGVLRDIDLEENACKEKITGFRRLVEKLQAKKNSLLEALAFQGGWVHPNGEIEFLPNYRPEDHWKDAFKKFYKEEYTSNQENWKKAVDASTKYMDQGHIRFVIGEVSGELDIEVHEKPTESQMRSLNKLQKENQYFTADLDHDAFPDEVYNAVTSWDMFRQAVSGKSERVKEAVATLSEPEAKVKKAHNSVKPSQLKKSTYPGVESDWRKFWILTDGTLIPVVHSHTEVPMSVGARIVSLQSEGAISGYVDEELGELALQNYDGIRPTSAQISTIKDIYNTYPVSRVIFSGVHDEEAYIESDRDLSNFLMTGKGRQRKAWESIKESLGGNSFSFKRKLPVPRTLIGPVGYIPEHPTYKYKVFLDNVGIGYYFVEQEGNQEFRILVAFVKSKFRGLDATRKFINYLKSEYNPEILSVDSEIHMVPFWRKLGFTRRGRQDRDKDFVYLMMEGKSWESIKESLTDYAREELDLAGLFDDDSDYNGMLGEAVMDLINLFASQGHSGFSAALTVDLFDRLASYKPLSELTDNKNEWTEVSANDPRSHTPGTPLWQSKRSPSCFSNDGGKTYWDIDEDYYKHTDEKGIVWSGGLTEEQWENRPIHKSKLWRKEDD